MKKLELLSKEKIEIFKYHIAGESEDKFVRLNFCDGKKKTLYDSHFGTFSPIKRF